MTLDAVKDTLLDGYGEYPEGIDVILSWIMLGFLGRLVIGLWIVGSRVYSALLAKVEGTVDVPGSDFTMDAAEGGVIKDGVDTDGLELTPLGKKALNEKLMRSCLTFLFIITL